MALNMERMLMAFSGKMGKNMMKDNIK